MHYFHSGAALTYRLLDSDGNLQEIKLGNNTNAGEQPQLLVPGGCWKATELCSGSYGLVSESVTPGFAYDDMELADSSLANQLPANQELNRFIKP